MASEPDDERLLGTERALGAEAASDVRGDDAQLRRIDAERPGDAHLIPVRHLRGEPGGDPAVSVRLGGCRSHLERARSHPLAVERLRDDDVAAVEERVVVLGRAGVARDVRPDLRVQQHLVLRGLQRVDDGRQRVVLDDDELRCVGAGGAILAQDDRDDVSDEANDVRGDERARHPLLEDRDGRGAHRTGVDVGAGQDLHVREGLGGALVDAGDASVREQRAHERDGERPLQGQVLDVLTLPAQEARVLDPENPIPEDAHASEPNAVPRGGQPLVVTGHASWRILAEHFRWISDYADERGVPDRRRSSMTGIGARGGTRAVLATAACAPRLRRVRSTRRARPATRPRVAGRSRPRTRSHGILSFRGMNGLPRPRDDAARLHRDRRTRSAALGYPVLELDLAAETDRRESARR